MNRSLLSFGLTVLWMAPLSAADTTSVLGGGICINEVMVKPNYDLSNGWDTDGSGSLEQDDEYVEFYNLSGSPIDISGWVIGDEDLAKHTFAPGTTIPSGGVLAVVSANNSGGGLPVGIIEADTAMQLDNSLGDGVFLSDGSSFIGVTWDGGMKIPNGAGEYLNGQTQVAVEDWGTDIPGGSLARYPDGDTNIIDDLGTDPSQSPVDDPNPGQLNTTSLPVELDSFSIE